MDILKPPIVDIDGRLYRKNYLTVTCDTTQSDQMQDEEEPYMEEDVNYDDGSCRLDDIQQTDKGYQITITDIPNAFYGYLIGKKGETRKRIENETQTKVDIKRHEEGPVIITSESRKGVIAARSRIELIVESARQKQSFTHFLSIPLVTPEIQKSVTEFKEDVMRNCSESEGLDQSLFQKSERLHLTLGTMALMNKQEVEKARSLLQKCKHTIVSALLEDEPLELSLSGIEYMNDDPSEVDVLYGKVQPSDGSNSLQLLADSFVEQFVNEGLMQKQYDRVKIHTTLINSLFRTDPDAETGHHGNGRQRGKDKRQKSRDSFDARTIIDKFSDYHFTLFQLNEIHISLRGSRDASGYYRNESFISLP